MFEGLMQEYFGRVGKSTVLSKSGVFESVLARL
jgi:hypothetical protein